MLSASLSVVALLPWMAKLPLSASAELSAPQCNLTGAVGLKYLRGGSPQLMFVWGGDAQNGNASNDPPTDPPSAGGVKKGGVPFRTPEYAETRLQGA